MFIPFQDTVSLDVLFLFFSSSRLPPVEHEKNMNATQDELILGENEPDGLGSKTNCQVQYKTIDWWRTLGLTLALTPVWSVRSALTRSISKFWSVRSMIYFLINFCYLYAVFFICFK